MWGGGAQLLLNKQSRGCHSLQSKPWPAIGPPHAHAATSSVNQSSAQRTARVGHSVRSAPGVLHPHGALLAVVLARLCGSGGKHQNRRNELSKMQGRQGTTCGSNTEGMPARPLDRCKRSRNLMHQCSTHPHQSRRWSPLSQTRAAGRRRPSLARPCRTGSASTVARPAT